MDAASIPASRIAIYARYSSFRQDERSIDDQVRRCRDHVLQQHRAADVEVYTDSAVSGASLDRRGFEAMMAAVDAGTVSKIVTEDVSRISRDFADAAQIFKRLQYARVPLIGIADGIDTSAKHAKLTYTLKSLVADLYLDDLRDKTLRGLEGRALAGLATGNVPYGYRTRPMTDGRGREIGRQIEIETDRAQVITRIFAEHAGGRSLASIARSLNRDGVASPRAGTRHRFAGWSVGTVREMLRNERYIGVWRFKTTQWVKVPGTNKRLPRKRPSDEVIVQQRPDLQIIDLTLWEAAHTRIPRGNSSAARPRRRSRYVLSGILVCECCDAPMTICGGAGLNNTYYRCATSRTKGICANVGSIRTPPLLLEVLGAIRDAVVKDSVVGEAIEAQNSHRGSVVQAINQRERALAETEAQIARVVDFIATSGQRFECVVEKMRALELAARSQNAELEVLRNQAGRSRRRISVKDIGAAITRIGGAGHEDADTARERLRRWLGGAPIRFDGSHIVIEVVPAALAADVAYEGAARPTPITGRKLVIRAPVSHLLARARPVAS
jgi:site-specific DNA recombinase